MPPTRLIRPNDTARYTHPLRLCQGDATLRSGHRQTLRSGWVEVTATGTGRDHLVQGLWATSACQAWHQALERYPDAVRAAGSERLVELDDWVQRELPARIANRAKAYVTVEELAGVTEWKMLRGDWRPRNLQLVRQNPPEEVERLSAEALALADDTKRPIVLLTRLGGVGPATASAVLATVHPDAFPFFDEAVAKQIPDLGPVKFITPYFYRYAEALRKRTANLNAHCQHDKWHVHQLDLALWSAVDGTK